MRVLTILLVCLAVPCHGWSAELPGKALDLSCWKLTLPAHAAGSQRPVEILQPKLDTFHDEQTFFVRGEPAGVVFRAPCGGVTTKGSKYPRSELREMTGPDGTTLADWSTNDSQRHTLVASLAVTHLPEVKPHVVCAQIHDDKDDLIMVRVEGRKLLVERNSDSDVMLDKNYQLGTFFDLKIEAGSGRVKVWYNGAEKMNWQQSRKGCYFKIGCYTQSNESKGDKPEAYGEVIVRSVRVEHAMLP